MSLALVEQGVSAEIAARRNDALAYYQTFEVPDDIYRQPGRPEREDHNIVHADIFDGARFVAWLGDEHGVLPPDVRAHVDIQRATHKTESLGAFDNTIEIPFINGELVSLGERELWNRRRSVMAAFVMAKTDSAFKPYARRTLYEHRHKGREEEMMLDAEVGTAFGLFSPCEPSSIGKKLGMFPEREMAVMQISWKKSAEQPMVLRSVSFDRASLGILRQLLAEQGIEPAAGAKPEDYLSYVFQKHFKSQEEFDVYVEAIKNRFDELVLKENPHLAKAGVTPRQGVVGYDARNVHSTIDMILHTPHGQLALNQEHKVDALLARHVSASCPLAPEIRMMAGTFVNGKRSDNTPLLTPAEKTKIHELLAAENVSLDNDDQADALRLVVILHNSAIEESLRDFLAGDKNAMDWMLSEGINPNDIRAILHAGTTAIENNRASGACGSSGEIGAGNLPSYKLYPNLYLIARLGRHNVMHGTCDDCGRSNRLVGRCKPKLCGGCYGEMTDKAKRGKYALIA